MREDVIGAVEAYLNGLGSKDLSGVPFHSDVTFEGPLGPPLKGAEAITVGVALSSFDGATFAKSKLNVSVPPRPGPLASATIR